MFLLAIQTSIQPYSLSILKDGACLRHVQLQSSYSYSEELMQHVDDLLRGAELNYSDVSCVAVSHGPGSYTGLRLGVSVAKTIGFVYRMPIIGVSALEAQVMGLAQTKRLYFSVMPARKGELNCQLFSFIEGDLNVLSNQYSQSEEDFIKKCKSFEKEISICGALSLNVRDTLSEHEHCALFPKELSGLDVGQRALALYSDAMTYSERSLNVQYSHLPLIGKST